MKNKTIRVLLIISLCLQTTFTLSQNNHKIDSLKLMLTNQKQDSLVIQTYLAIGYEYENMFPDSAISYYNKALAIATQNNYQKSTAKCLNYIGIVYKNQCNYPKALEYYQKALTINENIEDKEGIAANFGNIGNIYMAQSNYDKAIEYNQKALAINTGLNDSIRIANNYANIGIIYDMKGEYQKALEYMTKSLQIVEESGDEEMIAILLGNIGVIYMEKKDYTTAIEYYQKSLKICEKLGDKEGIASNLVNIGNLYRIIKQPETAIQYLKQSIIISKEISALLFEKEAYDYLTEIYIGYNDYKKALDYKNLWIKINDSIFNIEKTKSIEDMSARYESEKKAQQILLQQAELEKSQEQNAREKAERERQQSLRNMFIVAFVLMLLLAIFILRSYSQKKKANQLLTKQKKQIEETNEKLNTTIELVNIQKNEIEQAHAHIQDSINYASKIQSAVLSENILANKLADHFILYKPRDIVSGDFYWMKEIGTSIVVAVADCTGHGVPGAFMSMLGTAFLNEIVTENNAKMPGHILNELRSKIKTSLKQTGKKDENKDGMDIAIYTINTDTNTLFYAGANNPLFVIRKRTNQTAFKNVSNIKTMDNDTHTLYDIKGSRQPVGIYMQEKPFETIEVSLQKEDTLYTFSDGYVDQFGGETGHKFMTKAFKQLLLKICENPMSEQKRILNETIINWIGKKQTQIDDILIIGIRI
ncbi:MAG: tetratricopeptide repeat protein [Bacteroidales bacterium]|nr:tetratricopeptide repeat protein [Bacteroidales bacterium]